MTAGPTLPQTSFFSAATQKPDGAKPSTKRKAKDRQSRYRQTLAARRATELRNIADLILAVYLSNLEAYSEYKLFHYNLLLRAAHCGYDTKEMAKRIARARTKLRSLDAMNGFKPFNSIEEAAKGAKIVDGKFVRDA